MSRSAASSSGGVRGRPGSWDGYWVVDCAKSQSSAIHLEAMGLPLIAQQASEGVTPSYFINFSADGTSVTIKHMSQLGEKVRTFKLGASLSEVTKDNVSIKQHVDMPSYNMLVNSIEWPGRGKIVDTKLLVPSPSPGGNDVIQQRIEYSHRGGKRTVTDRIWYRGDEASALAAQAASEARAKGMAEMARGGAGDYDE